jgi:hypothetical protein
MVTGIYEEVPNGTLLIALWDTFCFIYFSFRGIKIPPLRDKEDTARNEHWDPRAKEAFDSIQ